MLVPDEWKPAALWAWNQTMGLTADSEGKPKLVINDKERKALVAGGYLSYGRLPP